jgi:hypothetical protein
MANTKKRVAWTSDNLKQLRQLAGRKTPQSIAKSLKRTEAAVRFKAHTNGISLAMR